MSSTFMLRAATTLAALASALPSVSIASVPSPSMRVTIVESVKASPPAASSPPVSTASTQEDASDAKPLPPESVAQTEPEPSNPITQAPATEVAAFPLGSSSAVPASMSWLLKRGSFLREALQEWADQAGWALVWHMPDKEDFRFDSDNRFSGDFKDAVIGLFDALPASIQIFAELRPDNVPPMLYITREQGVR